MIEFQVLIFSVLDIQVASRWHPGGIQQLLFYRCQGDIGGIQMMSRRSPGGVQLFHKNDSCDDKLDEIVKIIVQSVITHSQNQIVLTKL